MTWLSIADAAWEIGVHRRTIARWIKSGHLNAVNGYVSETDLLRAERANRAGKGECADDELRPKFEPAQWLYRDTPCQTVDPELWFTRVRTHIDQAISMCGECPAQTQCLSDALARQESTGIWGGKCFNRGRVVTPAAYARQTW